MRKRAWVLIALMLVIPGLLLTVSCAKKAVKKEASVMEKADDDAAEKARQAELEKQRKLEEQRILEEQRTKAERLEAERIKIAREKFENLHVYFAYDSSVLDDMAQTTLREKADWLRDNLDSTVLIEGHCDERGTGEYNLALGDRRADSAERFLINLGIDGHRLETVSYGEERPIDPGHGEEHWAKNRRAQFVVR
jgi:peptidoglycan-associated lipoprotein